MSVTLFSGNSTLYNYAGLAYLMGIEFRNVQSGDLLDFKLQIQGTTGNPSGTEFQTLRVLLGRASDIIANKGIPFFRGKLELAYDHYTGIWSGIGPINKALPDRYPTSSLVVLFPKDPLMNWPVPLLTVGGWSTSPNPFPMNSGIDQAYLEVET